MKWKKLEIEIEIKLQRAVELKTEVGEEVQTSGYISKVIGNIRHPQLHFNNSLWFTRRDIRREEEKYGKGRKDLRQEVKRERGRGSRQSDEQGRKGGREMGREWVRGTRRRIFPIPGLLDSGI